MSDEGRIRESALNIDTYLGAVDKETVREILRTLIREVLVGPPGRSNPALHNPHAVRWTGKEHYHRGSCPRLKYIESEPEGLPNARTSGQ